MIKLHFNSIMNSGRELQRQVTIAPGIRADAMFGDTIIEMLSKTRDVRTIRSKLLELAEAVASTSNRAILLLEVPHISTVRLKSIWKALSNTIRPEILARMSLVIHGDKKTIHLPQPIDLDLQQAIEELLAQELKRPSQPRARSTAFYDVLRVLMVHWFRQSGPITTKSLGKLTGYSYPTVAASLRRLSSYLTVHSDRRVELSQFPEKPWRQFVALSESVRSTKRYADRSGRPRALESLLDRLCAAGPTDTAVGGVVGARQYLPGLNLAGIPRLDLTISASSSPNLERLLQQLDPALKPAEPQEPARVCVHIVNQPQPLFTTDGDGRIWADEVDCMLDLHDAKLYEQAHELQTELAARATR